MQRAKNLFKEEIESGSNVYMYECGIHELLAIGRFILEARAISDKEYSPDSV